MMRHSIRLVAIAMAIMLALPSIAASPVALAAQGANCDGLDAYLTTVEAMGTQLAAVFPESENDDLDSWTSEQFTAASDAIDLALADLEAAEVPAIAQAFNDLLLQQMHTFSAMFDTMATAGVFGALIYAEQLDTVDKQLETAATEIETACGLDLYDEIENAEQAATPSADTGDRIGVDDDRDGSGDSGEAGTRAYPIPIGQTVEISDDWELTVLSVTPDATDQIMAESSFNEPPAAGQQFFMATVRVTYTGDDSETFYGWDLRTVGQTAVAYNQSVDDCGSIPDELATRELFTGGTIEGNLCWSIDSADADSLVLYNSDEDSDERIFLSLIPNDATGSDATPTAMGGAAAIR
ncbi:MAG TPA: hypothetical protein VFP05_08250 [Thermomicrobiales bacterium]|nr:hypothetical protein [Thermomicrobiales bacterium]